MHTFSCAFIYYEWCPSMFYTQKFIKSLPFGYKSDSHHFLMISFPLFQRFFFRILKFLHCWLLSKLTIFNFYLMKNLDSFIKIDFSFCRTFSFVQEVFSCENDRSKNNLLVKLELKETTFLQSRTQNLDRSLSSAFAISLSPRPHIPNMHFLLLMIFIREDKFTDLGGLIDWNKCFIFSR